MKPHNEEHIEGRALTRRVALSQTGPFLLLTTGVHAAPVEIGDSAVQDDEELRKLYTGVEWLFITQIIMPACGIPGKSGEESNSAYCHWLIGRQPLRDGVSLHLVYDLTTFSERYSKGTRVGVIRTTRIVDPHHHLPDSCTAFARVRSLEPDPRALLTAAVEERTKADGEDVAVIHNVSKKFLFTDRAWNLIESHVYRIG
jgi:hypothetical protein